MIKLGENQYILWSTIVDAPVSMVETREEMERSLYLLSPDEKPSSTLDMADEHGTSNYPHEKSAADAIACNAAGENGTELSLEEIIKEYSNPPWTVESATTVKKQARALHPAPRWMLLEQITRARELIAAFDQALRQERARRANLREEELREERGQMKPEYIKKLNEAMNDPVEISEEDFHKMFPETMGPPRWRTCRNCAEPTHRITSSGLQIGCYLGDSCDADAPRWCEGFKPRSTLVEPVKQPRHLDIMKVLKKQQET